MAALPCYAPSTPMHAHMALTARHSRIRLCIQERCCLGTATQTCTIACTHLHADYGAHTHGMQEVFYWRSWHTLCSRLVLRPEGHVALAQHLLSSPDPTRARQFWFATGPSGKSFLVARIKDTDCNGAGHCAVQQVPELVPNQQCAVLDTSTGTAA